MSIDRDKIIDDISSRIETELVGTRWESKDELEKFLRKEYLLQGRLSDVDESGLVADYAYVIGMFDDYGYMDIYYLTIPYGDEKIYITEVSLCRE